MHMYRDICKYPEVYNLNVRHAYIFIDEYAGIFTNTLKMLKKCITDNSDTFSHPYDMLCQVPLQPLSNYKAFRFPVASQKYTTDKII